MPNYYSPEWFDNFLSPIPPEQTAREIAFLARNLFQPHYTTLLDLCCGMGRHARELARLGYRVTGVDTSAYVLTQARRQDPLTRYVQGDMRALPLRRGTFDAVLILWQSFGNFEEAANEQILCDIANLSSPRGRLVLDMYHRSFHESRLGTRQFSRQGRLITETKTMEGNRLRVSLDYGDTRDEFEWQLYFPDEIMQFAKRCGFIPVLSCTNYDEQQNLDPEQPRMQIVFELPA